MPSKYNVKKKERTIAYTALAVGSPKEQYLYKFINKLKEESTLKGKGSKLFIHEFINSEVFASLIYRHGLELGSSDTELFTLLFNNQEFFIEVLKELENEAIHYRR
jgi:hypothetical protein